jgi:uncharacterized membrane protein YgcG
MNGFIPRTVLGLGLGLCSLAGCAGYREIVDPCWLERYNAMARQSVEDATNVQAANGHILDQTIWNYHFEHDKTGLATDKLNAAGIEHLTYISRRRPAPDTHLFLATAQDIPGLADRATDKALAERNDLNNRRIASIQRFLAIQTGGQGGYNIEVHDPAEVGIAAVPITGSTRLPVQGAYQKLQNNFQGVLPSASTSSGAGGGGSSSSSTSSTSSSSSSGGGSGGGGSGGPGQ